jgi:hypothetical protein
MSASSSLRVSSGQRRIVRAVTRRNRGTLLVAIGLIALVPLAFRAAGEVFPGGTVRFAVIDIIGAVLILIGLKLRADAAGAVPPPPPRPDVRPSDRSQA